MESAARPAFFKTQVHAQGSEWKSSTEPRPRADAGLSSAAFSFLFSLGCPTFFTYFLACLRLGEGCEKKSGDHNNESENKNAEGKNKGC